MCVPKLLRYFGYVRHSEPINTLRLPAKLSSSRASRLAISKICQFLPKLAEIHICRSVQKKVIVDSNILLVRFITVRNPSNNNISFDRDNHFIEWQQMNNSISNVLLIMVHHHHHHYDTSSHG